MAYVEWYDEDKYFGYATEYLLREKKPPSATTMREYCNHQGSLETHQKFLNKWKEAQHAEPIDLPSKAEAIIVKRARDLVAEGWKALEDESKEEIARIKNEAQETIRSIKNELFLVTKDRDEVYEKLISTTELLEKANAQILFMQNKLNLIESNHAQQQTTIIKLEHQREALQKEKAELEDFHMKREKDLRDRLVSNETRHQEDISRKEEEKTQLQKQYENKLSAIEIIRDELYRELAKAKSDTSFFEAKYQHIYAEWEKYTDNITKVTADLEKNSKALEEQRLVNNSQQGLINQLEKEIEHQQGRNQALEYSLNSKNSRIEELDNIVKQLLNTISRQNQEEFA